MRRKDRFAIVTTHMGARKRLVEMPWLETEYRVDNSDWTVLSHDGWRAAAGGDPGIWDALERKVLIGCYLNQPELVAVVGHPCGRSGPDPAGQGYEEVRRIVRHVGSFLLPTAVLGFWTDEDGWLEDVVEPLDTSDGEAARRVEEDVRA